MAATGFAVGPCGALAPAHELTYAVQSALFYWLGLAKFQNTPFVRKANSEFTNK
jgi:hypothetical protein